MGACCSPLELQINNKDFIQIFWALNSNYNQNEEMLKKYITKSIIIKIDNLKDFLENLMEKNEKLNNENESFLFCTKSDSEKFSKAICEIPTIIKVFPIGIIEKNSYPNYGKKIFQPNVFRMALKSCMIELENLRISREDRIDGILINFFL